jgi:hypothetical protein
LVDLLSMAPLGVVRGSWWTVPKLAHRRPFGLDYNHIRSILG